MISAGTERHMLPQRRFAGPMPWVIAIMIFLTVLAAAAGLGLSRSAEHLRAGLSDRITIQIVTADPDQRERETAAALRELAQLAGIANYHRVDQNALAELLSPWLGEGGIDKDIALPAMIDVDLAPGARAQLGAIGDAVHAVAPTARIDDHARWMAPLDRLIHLLRWLALSLVLLMATATACTVVLAARAALDLHHDSIAVIHMLGATDGQIARLFQRQIAIDALAGGLTGFLAAVAVVLLVGQRISGLGSELIGSVSLPFTAWLLLLLLPLAGVLLSMATARLTILLALRRML